MADKKEKFIPALGYDFLTVYYDLAIKITMPERKFRQRLVEILDAQAQEKILEFGFGTGQNLCLVKEKCPDANLVGLDIDPKVKEIADYKLRKKGLDIPLNLYDGGSFPYPDAHFDKVYSCLVFHQLEKETKLACLKEIHRVLKPNGTLVIADWGKADNLLMRFAFGFVQLLDGFKTTNDNVKGLMPEIIKETGFITKTDAILHINTFIGTFSYYFAKKSS